MTKRAAHHLLDVYGANLYCCRSEQQWRRLGRLIPLPKRPGGKGATSGARRGNGDYAVVIFVDPELTGRERAETVAHEASHAGRFILDHIGETAETHECEAYLVGWIAGWVTEQIEGEA